MTDTAGIFPKITFIGFGEAAHAVASGWQPAPERSVHAYDLKLQDPEAAEQVTMRCGAAGV